MLSRMPASLVEPAAFSGSQAAASGLTIATTANLTRYQGPSLCDALWLWPAFLSGALATHFPEPR